MRIAQLVLLAKWLASLHLYLYEMLLSPEAMPHSNNICGEGLKDILYKVLINNTSHLKNALNTSEQVWVNEWTLNEVKGVINKKTLPSVLSTSQILCFKINILRNWARLALANQQDTPCCQWTTKAGGKNVNQLIRICHTWIIKPRHLSFKHICVSLNTWQIRTVYIKPVLLLLKNLN